MFIIFLLKFLTRKPAKEVINPSFVSSHTPPNSSSSICWKLLKYKYVIPALTNTNLKPEPFDKFANNVISCAHLAMR